MYRFLVLAMILIACFGCNGDHSVAVDETAKSVQATDTDLYQPDFDKTSEIALIGKEGKVSVGDKQSHAFEVFPEPEKAFEFSDLPPGLSSDYEARGWESPSRGFGIITLNGLVVAALAQTNNTDRDKLIEIRKAYIDEMGEADIEAGNGDIRYWMWERGNHRLMVMSFKNPSGTINITTAMGDATILDTLDISRTELNAQIIDANKILEEAKTAGK